MLIGVNPMIDVGISVSTSRPDVIDLIVTREQMHQNEILQSTQSLRMCRVRVGVTVIPCEHTKKRYNKIINRFGDLTNG